MSFLWTSRGTSRFPVFSSAPLGAQDKTPPKTWADNDSVYRVPGEPGSSALYFNFDAYTPDGLHMPDLATRRNVFSFPPRLSQAAANPTHPCGRPQNQRRVFFSEMSPVGLSTVYAADSATGALWKLVALPAHASVITINADETLLSGTWIEAHHAGDDDAKSRPHAASMPIGMPSASLVQPRARVR